MLRALLALTLAMICCTVAAAQQPNRQCPTISINGPDGTTPTGEIAEFSADIKGADTSKLKFEWQPNFGTIESGQGSPRITVRRTSPQGSGTYVDLEIQGLPEGCPNSFTETAPDEGPVPPTELEVFTLPLRRIETERFQRIVNIARDNPTDQIVIVVPPDEKTRTAFGEMLAKSPLKKLIDERRVTDVVGRENDPTINIYLVPPGSKMPVCDECKIVEPCPVISVTGPAGIIRPGAVMTFTANVPNDYRGGYKWSVSAGNIESSPTNPWISVRVPSDIDTAAIIATVELDGLPGGCPNGASEKGLIDIWGDPVEADNYDRLPISREKERLRNIAVQLRANPGSTAVFLISVPSASKTAFASRKKTISGYLNTIKIGNERLRFVLGDRERYNTSIYIFPTGAYIPSLKY